MFSLKNKQGDSKAPSLPACNNRDRRLRTKRELKEELFKRNNEKGSLKSVGLKPL